MIDAKVELLSRCGKLDVVAAVRLVVALASPQRVRSRNHNMQLRHVVASLVVALAAGDHPCDEEHGKFCPSDGPKTLGACLKKHERSEACDAWVTLHDACEAELAGYCARACDGETCGYANEAVACLTKWTKQEEVSEGCRAAFPPEPVKVERVQSEKAKARSAARKAARAKAAEQVRRMQAGEDVAAEAADSGPAAALPSGAEL